MKKIDPLLYERLQTLIHSMGYTLVGCESLSQGRQQVLRIYIDKLNDQLLNSGINIDDCARVSRQVSAMLDVEEAVSGRYTLEVSSPGINRPLFELHDYERYVGNRINIKLVVPLDGRRHYKGVLLKVEDNYLHLLVDNENEFKIPFSNIEKANLMGEVRF